MNLPPAWLTRDVFEDWQVEDPDGKSVEVFRRVREEIRERVAHLVASMQPQSTAT